MAMQWTLWIRSKKTFFWTDLCLYTDRGRSGVAKRIRSYWFCLCDPYANRWKSNRCQSQWTYGSSHCQVKTGDVVEIITNANSFGPSRDWVKLVKTNKARNKIRQFFKNQDKELSVNKGRDLLVSYFQEQGYVANKYLDKNALKQSFQSQCEEWRITLCSRWVWWH